MDWKFYLQKDGDQVSGSFVPTSQWDIIHKTVEGDEQWLTFLPPRYLWDTCSDARRGRATALCPLSLEWNWENLRLFHPCQSSDFGPEFVPLKAGKQTNVCSCLAWEIYLVPWQFSQISFWRRVRMSVQTPLRLLELAAGSLLKDEASAIAALEFLPAELFLPLFMKAFYGRHTDSEGHGVSLALCPSASGGPDAHASQGNFRSNPGWS